MIAKRLLVTLFAVVSIGAHVTQAQESIVLTVEVSQFMGDTYNAAYFDAFRAAHPGVDVVVVLQDPNQSYPPGPAWDTLENHLNAVGDYTTSADVLFVQPDSFVTQESTRAGYWLDLKPLVLADPDLAEANFYPVAWRSYQWDGGMWALPTGIRLNVLTYDPVAFDQAGLTYPDEHWTIDNFAAAAVALTEKDADHQPIKPGCFCDENLMYYSLLGGGLKTLDDSPQLDKPELAALLEKWSPINAQIYPANGYSTEGVPLQMSGVQGLTEYTNEPMTPAHMPGNFTSAYVEGFGVSAGTAHPDLAFALAKFLAENPRNGFGIPGLFPGLRTADTSAYTSINKFSPENQAFIDEALENAVGGSDFLFFGYLYDAENQMRQEGIDAATALKDAQAKAIANLEAAAQWTGAQNLMVATPAPTPQFGADEIVLHFGISQQQVTNPQDWERIAQAFAASDPQVGQLMVDYQEMDYQAFMDNNDCYYLTYDGVDSGRIADYVSLDPYTSADPNFIPSDFLPGTLENLQLEDKTWGYPLSMQPVVLLYNPDTFQKAGIPLPGSTWTTSDFSDAMQALQKTDLGGTAAFSPRYAENADWLMLIAAYGGLPIDYRTSPPTVNFTAPATVDAMRQVLDLAKAGAIHYLKLGTFSYMEMSGPGAISATQLNGYVNFIQEFSAVNFPQGNNVQTMGLGDVGGMYISQHAQNPDACYRWMATVAAHPELLPGVMPANMSAINDPALLAAQGENAVAMYQEFARLLSAPNTIIFHSGFGGGLYSYEMLYINQWLNRAFDSYVLDGGDLEAALTDAQSKVKDFAACTAKLPDLSENMSEADTGTYYTGVFDCVKLVDPAMAAEQENLSQGS